MKQDTREIVLHIAPYPPRRLPFSDRTRRIHRMLFLGHTKSTTIRHTSQSTLYPPRLIPFPFIPFCSIYPSVQYTRMFDIPCSRYPSRSSRRHQAPRPYLGLAAKWEARLFVDGRVFSRLALQRAVSAHEDLFAYSGVRPCRRLSSGAEKRSTFLLACMRYETLGVDRKMHV
jgi:hypothetical protein